MRGKKYGKVYIRALFSVFMARDITRFVVYKTLTNMQNVKYYVKFFNSEKDYLNSITDPLYQDMYKVIVVEDPEDLGGLMGVLEQLIRGRIDEQTLKNKFKKIMKKQ